MACAVSVYIVIILVLAALMWVDMTYGCIVSASRVTLGQWDRISARLARKETRNPRYRPEAVKSPAPAAVPTTTDPTATNVRTQPLAGAPGTQDLRAESGSTHAQRPINLKDYSEDASYEKRDKFVFRSNEHSYQSSDSRRKLMDSMYADLDKVSTRRDPGLRPSEHP